MNAVTILGILDVTLQVLERQAAVRAAYQQVRDELKTMVDEGRDPTPAEWASLEAKLNASKASLDSRADEARRLLNDR